MTTHLTTKEKILAAKFTDDRKNLVARGLVPATTALRTHDIKEALRISNIIIRLIYQPVRNGIKAITVVYSITTTFLPVAQF